MGEWSDAQADLAEMNEADGDECLITPTGGTTSSVSCFWEGKNIDGGDQGGERCWVAVADLPTTLPQGSTLTYPATGGTAYTIAVKEPDGHGLMLLTLTDESEL